MRYSYQTVVGTSGGPYGNGTSQPVPLDVLVNPFSVGIGVSVSGTVNYTVQHTFDDLWNGSFSAGSANWWTHASLLNQTTNQDGNYAFPVRAVRLVVNSGTGSATMAVGQSGLL